MKKYVFRIMLIMSCLFSISALAVQNTDTTNIGLEITEENQRTEATSRYETVTWSKTFGGEQDDYLRSLIKTDDGGYLLFGETYSYGAGKADIWIIKLDLMGNQIWDKTFGGPDDDWINILIQSDDGGYVLAGKTYSYGAGGGDAWIIKLDSVGNKIWEQILGGSNNDSAYLLLQNDDGGYTVGGYTFSLNAGRADFWIIRLDPYGNELWEKPFGGSGEDTLRSLIQTDDGGYLLSGITYSYGAGEGDFWILKLDEKGNLSSPSVK